MTMRETNRETRIVAMWLRNEENAYRTCKQIALWSWRASVRLEEEKRLDSARADTAEQLQRMFIDSNESAESGVLADLLVNALYNVDWSGIAEEYVQDAIEYDSIGSMRLRWAEEGE